MTEIFLFGDTETTGFPKSGNLIQEGQARVCQVAFLLTDENGKSLAEFSSLIKPEGWTIPEEVSKIHGFTTEICEAYGLPHEDVINIYLDLIEKAETEVYHNQKFDRQMLLIERAYNDIKCRSSGDELEGLPELPKQFCTMLESTKVCKIPSPKGGYKWPKLSEALQIICGKTLGDQAHDALWDARACRDIFFGLRAKKAA